MQICRSLLQAFLDNIVGNGSDCLHGHILQSEAFTRGLGQTLQHRYVLWWCGQIAAADEYIVGLRSCST